MPTIKVPVTEEMIAKAIPADCYGCLIAIALREATGLQWHVVNTSARENGINGVSIPPLHVEHMRSND